MKMLFAGFRHGHIDALYQKAQRSALVEIAACVEPDPVAAQSASTRLGIEMSRLSYDQLLRSDAEIVAIGSRYGERGEMIRKALEAGKHVIADKPICTRETERKQIAALSKKNGLKIGCMLDLRYMPSALRAGEILKSNRLGQVRNVSFTGQHCLFYGTRPDWYFEQEMHGGTINDLAIHGIDLVMRLCGVGLRAVNAARCWNAYADRQPHFKDCAIFMAELTNGAGLLADVSYSAPSQVFDMPTYWDFKLWCEKGLIAFGLNDPKVYVFEEGRPKVQALDGIMPQTDYLEDFITEIQTGSTELTDSVLRATEAALHIQAAADKPA